MDILCSLLQYLFCIFNNTFLAISNPAFAALGPPLFALISYVPLSCHAKRTNIGPQSFSSPTPALQ